MTEPKGNVINADTLKALGGGSSFAALLREEGDHEEMYFFTHGRGFMGADGEERAVKAGDAFYVRPGPFHTTRNPYDVPLEFFWITINVE